MADETKTNIFGKKNADAPKTTDAESNATATTSGTTDSDSSKPSAEVTDDEAEALDGAGGPNTTPAFAKQDFRDENVQLTDTDDLASAKAGAAAQSAPTPDFADAMAAAAAGDSVPEGREDEVQFTSTPIARLKLGRFQFENGVLRLKPKDAEEFEKLLGNAALRTQQTVRRIDRSAGEVVARRFLEQTKSKSVQGVDTSDRTARTAPRPQ